MTAGVLALLLEVSATAQPMGHMVDEGPVMCLCPGKP